MAHVVVSRLPFIVNFIVHSSLFIIPFCIQVVVIAAESLSTSSVNNSSVPSTTNPAVEKSVNAGRKRAESTRTRDSSTNNSLPGMAHVVVSILPFTINFIIHSSF
jgi:hypothetical protein